ncbi:MAG: transcription antitermination factor NusB [Gemmatimonadota bacterium]|nr:MAG: transcription antitermination factor NusB [Gemmatimonadota bacterium]
MRAVSRGRRIDLAFAEASDRLDSRGRRWVQELVYGTLRLRGRLDHLLDAQLDRGVDSVAADVLDVLRLGAYQVLYMGSVPGYAAVSQTVDQARAVGGRGVAGLVNAVLRSVARVGDGPEHFPDRETRPAEYLSTWGSHPRWLVDRWLTRWSSADVERLVEANNEVPTLFVRPLGVCLERAAERLGDHGIIVGPEQAGGVCLRIESGHTPSEVLNAIPGIIQDPASALVTAYVGVDPDSMVADLCSAPGGKALSIAEGARYVVAADASMRRMDLLRSNADRLGSGISDRVGMVVADARRPAIRGADVVLLDVPCSGTGTLRRHPDARWRLDPEGVAGLVALQAEILEAASDLVPSGGLLVYATCSLEEEENAAQVEAFLGGHPEFSVDPGTGVDRGHLDQQGLLRLLPQVTGFDGAFAARLRRA